MDEALIFERIHTIFRLVSTILDSAHAYDLILAPRSKIFLPDLSALIYLKMNLEIIRHRSSMCRDSADSFRRMNPCLNLYKIAQTDYECFQNALSLFWAKIQMNSRRSVSLADSNRRKQNRRKLA